MVEPSTRPGVAGSSGSSERRGRIRQDEMPQCRRVTVRPYAPGPHTGANVAGERSKVSAPQNPTTYCGMRYGCDETAVTVGAWSACAAARLI